MTPGSQKLTPLQKFKTLKIWKNLDLWKSITFIKVSLLTAYNSIHKFDIISLSETYLNFEILSNDEHFDVPGHKLIRADHPSNTKRGGVCIYLKDSLPLRLLVTSINASVLKLWFQINFVTSYHLIDRLANLVMNLRILSITYI